VGVLSGAAAASGVFDTHPVTAHSAFAESWIIPAQVNTALAAPASKPPSLPSVKAPADAPTHLRIPAISVTTTLEPLGLEANGHLAAPAYSDAGWYAGGTNPGDVGPAVIAGHYDAKTNDTPSVFYRLGTLKVGDEIQVERNGKWLTFSVTAVASYPQNNFPTTLVYGPTPTAELRLITCGGTFSSATQSYSDDVVVFAAETTT
jgi:LPXTG-site transpeptidase (sortase) family protein